MGVFSKKYGKIVDAIITESKVYSPVELQSTEVPCVVEHAVTLWDTGSMCTLISPTIVQRLALQPIGDAELVGIGGDTIRKVYLVHLALPDGSLLPNLQVVEEEHIDCDVVIGMDVITATDMCLTNKDFNTIFSLRVPTKEHIELKEI